MPNHKAFSRFITVSILATCCAMALARPARCAPDDAFDAATRYSSLDEINAGNVQHLQPAFSFRTGVRGSLSGAPQFSDGTLFLLTPFPHTLFALDAASATIKWSFAPNFDATAEGLACCSDAHNGPVIDGQEVYFTTLDGHVTVVEAHTGRLIRDTSVANPQNGETLSAAPLMIGDRILVGNSGDEFGVRGWIAALDRQTGHPIWKRYNTGPDSEVGIDSQFKPFFARDRGRDLGTATWPPSAWQQGGGGLSGSLVYDSELNLVFHGTGHPAPWNPQQRPGDNKWTSGLFARALDAGSARWFTGFNPHDLYAIGSTGALAPVDRDWNGAPRRLLIHPNGNGYLYVIDRTSGELLAADPFVPINAIRRVDIGNGDLEREPAKSPRTNMTTRNICPAWTGASGPASYSPVSGLLYLPANRLCMDMEARDVSFIRGTAFTGANIRITSPTSEMGGLLAWDIAGRRAAWSVAERYPLGGGVLATGGGLVIYGTLDGFLKAVDARTGNLLWQFQTASPIMSQPVTYRAADGRQYLAVTAGAAGRYGLAIASDINSGDETAALGLAHVLRDLPRPADPSGTLRVFRLP